MKKQKYNLQRFTTFEIFCEDLKTELGETLYDKVKPVALPGNRVELTIPDGAETRISETLQYGSCHAEKTNY